MNINQQAHSGSMIYWVVYNVVQVYSSKTIHSISVLIKLVSAL